MGQLGRLRRSLFAIVFLFTCVFTYLYWNQVKQNVSSIRQRSITNSQSPRSSSAVSEWSWSCTNNHCVRQVRTTPANGVSLATCNMLCGSTQLWPQPTGPVTLASHSFAFLPEQFNMKIVGQCSAEAEDLINRAFEVFKSNVIALVQTPNEWTRQTDIQAFDVSISVNSSDTTLALSTNETYLLTLHPQEFNLRAHINANNFFGVRHALETLTQFVWWDDFLQQLRVLKAASVRDGPKFAYRGLMVDTARNFFSVEALKRTLRAMAANKLNVFHWHITDSQSFPFDAPSRPQMAKTGAYDASKRYSAAEISDIVDYAKIRGIRVLIEIDTPAHVGMGWTWGPQEGLGNLALCVGQQPWVNYCGEPPCGQLNPQNPNVYRVLENLYSDIFSLTGEREMFHIGGDEVNLECWSQHRQTMNFNYTDLNEMWGDFTLAALRSVQRANNNKVPSYVIIWSSNLTKPPYILKYLDSRFFVVQVWGASTWPETIDLLEMNYKIILSHVDAWYLDCGFGRWRETGDAACDPYRTWHNVYLHRPWQAYSQDKWHLILGGEACLWTEQVSETSLDTRLWPRLAAFAERLWSDQPVDSRISEDTYTRLSTQSTRLQARGVQTENMWPNWCNHNPGMCL